MILIPNKGKLVKNNGNNAQWMAHAREAVIPNASQLIFKLLIVQIYLFATSLQINSIFESINNYSLTVNFEVC